MSGFSLQSFLSAHKANTQKRIYAAIPNASNGSSITEKVFLLPDIGETFSHFGETSIAKGFFHPDFGNKQPHLGNSLPQSGNSHTAKGSKHPTKGNSRNVFGECREAKTTKEEKPTHKKIHS